VLLDPDYLVLPLEEGSTKDTVFISVHLLTSYTSNDKYANWTLFFIVILATLVGLLVFSLICYKWQVYIFTSKTNERRDIKRQLMKLNDQQYSNFLKMESENIQRFKQSFRQKFLGGINQGFTNEEISSEEDKSD
jgi:hypothetical protein